MLPEMKVWFLFARFLFHWGLIIGSCWGLWVYLHARYALSSRAQSSRALTIIVTDGEWISTIVDDQLYTTRLEYQDSDVQARSGYHGTEQDYTRDFMRGSKALYFGKCHDPNETWLPLLEKAYAKAHGDYGAIEDGCPGYTPPVNSLRVGLC